MSVVVLIPCDTSCYHIFNASHHNHQTPLPFVESDTHVTFTDALTFIFAWGNGKCDKRAWMEAQIFQCEPRATQTHITNFFNTLNVYDQAHMVNEAYYEFNDTFPTH